MDRANLLKITVWHSLRGSKILNSSGTQPLRERRPQTSFAMDILPLRSLHPSRLFRDSLPPSLWKRVGMYQTQRDGFDLDDASATDEKLIERVDPNSQPGVGY